MRLIVLFFVLAGAALAGEYAVLASGARLHIDRHEADGAKVRLYHGTGFVELDSAIVRNYEAEEYVAAVPVLTLVSQPEAMAATEAPATGPAPAPPTPPELADAAADRYGLPRELVRSVMAVIETTELDQQLAQAKADLATAQSN